MSNPSLLPAAILEVQTQAQAREDLTLIAGGCLPPDWLHNRLAVIDQERWRAYMRVIQKYVENHGRL